jgi:hypothetical protein
MLANLLRFGDNFYLYFHEVDLYEMFYHFLLNVISKLMKSSGNAFNS